MRQLVILALVIGTSTASADRAKPRCARVIAGDERGSDLRRVGVVTQGTQRGFLLVGPSNRGYIAWPGDCVGREHAPIDRDGRSPGDYPRPGVLVAEASVITTRAAR